MSAGEPGDERPDGGIDWQGWPVVATIWQTVDVERTVAALGLQADPVDVDELLGGRGVIVRPADGPSVVILEPSTEGHLAAGLARNDEGPAGRYVAPPGGIDEARRAGLATGAEGRGPFGREALGFPPGRPPVSGFVVIVDPPAATIEP
jgi:hypothetical protein